MKGFWKRAAMGLLAIAMLLCAACAAPEQEPEQEMQTDIAGADWRTYGQVSDAGTITRAGEKTSVLACVFDSGVEFYLDELCLAREFQRRGFGSRFMAEIRADLKKRGLNGILLNTSRRCPSFRFYRKLGFEPFEKLVVMGVEF